jgi:hypothetical protein
MLALGAMTLALAQTPSEFRQHMREWSGEAAVLLNSQPRRGPLRTALRDWLESQADSLSAVPTGLVGPAQPVKMRASAAFVLDRANEYRADLKPTEFEGLMALADRMADHCHAAYGKTQNPCTNADYWILKGLISVARARQPGADAARALAPVMTWMRASFTPPPGSWKKAEDMPEEVCTYWWRSMRVQLNDELFPVGDANSDNAFLDAYLALVPGMLDACQSLEANHAWQTAPALEKWAEAIETSSATLGRKPVADAALVREAATRARQLLEASRR